MSAPNPATTPWVPMWNLNGGVDLRYNGAYVGGTQYADGDIVVQNGIAYLCVRPTVNPPAVWPMAPGVTAYGTSLPASPYNGQEAVLVDSVANPSYQWCFRYNATSTSPYKWESVGGSAWMTNDESDVTTASVQPTFVTLGTLAAFTAPRDGDYEVVYGTNYYNPTQNVYAYVGLALAGVNQFVFYINSQWVGAWMGASSRTVRLNAVSAGAVIDVRHAVGSANVGHFIGRHLVVRPIRVA